MGTNTYVTASRKSILNFLQSCGDRMVTAADVAAHLKEQEREVNITTIYRYLDKLAKDRIVIKYAAEKGGQAAYQYAEPGRNCEQHLHMKCIYCGTIIHLECHFMEEISGHILKEHDFELQCRNSILYGVCGKCRGTRE